jgi:hypothetical protein
VRLPDRREPDPYRQAAEEPPEPPAERVEKRGLNAGERFMLVLLGLFVVASIAMVFALRKHHTFGEKHVVLVIVSAFVGGTISLLVYNRLDPSADARRGDRIGGVFIFGCLLWGVLGYGATVPLLHTTAAPAIEVHCVSTGQYFRCQLPDGDIYARDRALQFPRDDRFRLKVRRTFLGTWLFDPDSALLE